MGLQHAVIQSNCDVGIASLAREYAILTANELQIDSKIIKKPFTPIFSKFNILYEQIVEVAKRREGKAKKNINLRRELS